MVYGIFFEEMGFLLFCVVLEVVWFICVIGNKKIKIMLVYVLRFFSDIWLFGLVI